MVLFLTVIHAKEQTGTDWKQGSRECSPDAHGSGVGLFRVVIPHVGVQHDTSFTLRVGRFDEAANVGPPKGNTARAPRGCGARWQWEAGVTERSFKGAVVFFFIAIFTSPTSKNVGTSHKIKNS